MSVISASLSPGTVQDLIIQGATQLQFSRYSVAAVLALSIYDWVISLREEYDLIHCARWTGIKVAYLFCRYYPLLVFPVFAYAFIGNHTYQACQQLVHPVYALIIPCQLSAQAVMVMRAYAFTGRNKFVFAVLGISFLALTGAEIWLFGTQYIASKDLFRALGSESGCFGSDVVGQGVVFFSAFRTGFVLISAFFLDFLITILVAIHCIRLRSSQGPLGRSFLIQGFIAFLAMSAVNLFTAVLYLGVNRAYHGVGLPFAIGLPDILACRLVLLLRRRVSPTESQELLEQSRIVREGFELLDRQAQQRHYDFMDDVMVLDGMHSLQRFCSLGPVVGEYAGERHRPEQSTPTDTSTAVTMEVLSTKGKGSEQTSHLSDSESFQGEKISETSTSIMVVDPRTTDNPC